MKTLFKTLYIEKNAFEFLIAYPSRFGIDSVEQLHTWESGDRANRELFFCTSKQQAIELYNHYNNG